MKNKFRKRQWAFTAIYLVWGILAVWSLRTNFAPARPKEIGYSELLSDVQAGRLAEVSIDERQITGKLKPSGAPAKKGAPPPNLGVVADRIPGLNPAPLVAEMQKANVKFSGKVETESWWTGLMIAWGPMLLLFGIYGFAMWKMRRGGGPLSFGKNRARIHDDPTRFDTSFSDVAGVEEAKAELGEVLDFLRNPQKYQRLGGRIPKGVLLIGPPGTGKTLLARAAAGEAGVPFFSISGSEFVEMFVGVGASRVRDLFEQAAQKAPCIIFIDELDAIGKTRAAAQAMFSNDEREQTLNQLLVEMDGFDPSKGVIIMAATNTPEVLDPALMRPGRFDRQIILDRPDLEEREAILKVHARKLRAGPDVNLNRIAAETPGMVGADLANIMNEAALAAARRGAERIEMRDCEAAVDRVTLGFEKKGRLISPEEKERVAFHESGHALVALSVPYADPVRRVSIIPRSIGALGHTLQLPAHDKYLLTEPELEDGLSVLLGGRAAEEIAYGGIVSTGASDDLEKASELARQMVTRYGMSEQLGTLTYGLPRESRFLRTAFGLSERNYSERIAEQIDADVRRLTDRLYARSKSILEKRRDDLNTLVHELIEKETLDRDELTRLLKTPPVARDVQPAH